MNEDPWDELWNEMSVSYIERQNVVEMNSEILPDLLNLEWTYSRDQNGNRIEFDWSDWKIEKQNKIK